MVRADRRWCLWCSGRCMLGSGTAAQPWSPGGKGSTPFGYPHTSVLLGELAASKSASRSFDSSRSCFCPDGVADLHWTLRRSRPWFKSRSEYWPASVSDRTTVFGTARRGSTPRRAAMSSECAGFAHDPAKVEVQVRFLARTLRRDAGARRYGGCLQSSFPVGSTPTGVSHGRLLATAAEQTLTGWFIISSGRLFRGQFCTQGAS